MYRFNRNIVTATLITWIKDWFDKNGEGCKAVIGISGDKDSTIAAKLCVEALGADRVLGVLMPNGFQNDINVARKVVEYLGVENYEINIQEPVEDIHYLVETTMNKFPTDQMSFNLPARIRMSVLYAVAQNLKCGGRVINTGNLSERYVGYTTLYGDSAGDICPLGGLTKTEVVSIGDCLGLPESLVHKTPSDGLTGKTDEDNFGFTYDVLDKYIRTGMCADEEIGHKIELMHKKNEFKLSMPPIYKPNVDTRIIRNSYIQKAINEHKCPAPSICDVATTVYEPKDRERKCLRCWLDYCEAENFEIDYEN